MKKSRKEEIIRENKLKKEAKKRFCHKREAEIMHTTPILNRKETKKKIFKKYSQCQTKNGTNTDGSGQ